MGDFHSIPSLSLSVDWPVLTAVRLRRHGLAPQPGASPATTGRAPPWLQPQCWDIPMVTQSGYSR